MKDLPLISYERSMNHNYMVLAKPDFFGTSKAGGRSYRERMLLENHIQGLLPITYKQAGGENRYYYEINSLQPLDRLIEKRELKYDDFKAILIGCAKLFDRLEEYLLDGGQVLLSSEFIFVNVESMEPQFVCYPEYEGDARRAFMDFIDELLVHIDHADNKAVLLGYQVYRYTRNPNYILSEIYKFMEDDKEKAAKTIKKEEFSFTPQGVCEPAADSDVKKSVENSEVAAPAINIPPYDYSADERESEEECGKKKGDIKELAGGIFCVLVAMCAGALIIGARILHCYTLSGNNELYIYGALAMAGVSAVLFFVCYVKSMKSDEMDDEQDEDAPKQGNAEIKQEVKAPEIKRESNIVRFENAQAKKLASQSLEDTVVLGDKMLETRALYGKVNGTDVSVPLDHLPLTVGKLSSLSDFTINDNAVSKMHARFEEQGGRVCVCDLNSTNGTAKNGELIEINTPVALSPGDKIRIGRSCFTYY